MSLINRLTKYRKFKNKPLSQREREEIKTEFGFYRLRVDSYGYVSIIMSIGDRWVLWAVSADEARDFLKIVQKRSSIAS